MITPKPRPGTDVHLVLVELAHWVHTRPTWVLDGTVIDTFWWEKDPGTFCLFVPGTEVPLRVIHMKHVVSINKQLVEGWNLPSPKSLSWRIESNSYRDQFYTVSFDGEWRCTCRGFAFHRNCTHIRHVQGEQKCLT